MTRGRSNIELSLFIHKLTKAALLVSEMERVGPDGTCSAERSCRCRRSNFPTAKKRSSNAGMHREDRSSQQRRVLQLNLLVPEWLAEREGLI